MSNDKDYVKKAKVNIAKFETDFHDASKKYDLAEEEEHSLGKMT